MSKKEKINDEELVEMIRQGNEYAQDMLLERYRRYSWKIAHDFMKDNLDSGIQVDDLMNVAFYSVHVAITKYVGETQNFYPYWKVIAKNEILKYIEKNSYKDGGKSFNGISLDSELENDVLVSEILGDSDTSFAELRVMEEVKKIIFNKECGLKRPEVKVAKLMLKGLSPEEIRKATKFSLGKTYYLINKVKEKLYTELRERYLIK